MRKNAEKYEILKAKQQLVSEIKKIPDKNLNKYIQDWYKLIILAQGDNYEDFSF